MSSAKLYFLVVSILCYIICCSSKNVLHSRTSQTSCWTLRGNFLPEMKQNFNKFASSVAGSNFIISLEPTKSLHCIPSFVITLNEVRNTWELLYKKKALLPTFYSKVPCNGINFRSTWSVSWNFTSDSFFPLVLRTTETKDSVRYVLRIWHSGTKNIGKYSSSVCHLSFCK